MEGLSAMRATHGINRQCRVLWAALALVAALSLLSSVINPLFEPPDEFNTISSYATWLMKENCQCRN